jgi:hypothetical protein
VLVGEGKSSLDQEDIREARPMRDLLREGDGSRLGTLLGLPPHVSHLGERMSSFEELKASVVFWCSTFGLEHQFARRLERTFGVQLVLPTGLRWPLVFCPQELC